ncbi:MAG TPA: PAS domain S-box protein [Bacteroidetes bacterium]|nr:PAS domain S-box protein [Bacteroidota bacterium]
MKNPADNLEFLQVILNSIADGVFTIDNEMRITSFNQAAEKITGIPASKAIGKKCSEIFHSDLCENGCALQRTFQTGEAAIDVPVHIINNRGKKTPISVSTSILKDKSGQVLGAVETFRDLSTIEQLQKEIKKSYTFEDIVSKSPLIHKIFQILPDVAESDSTVLIQGPSGSGKELFARAIHNLSLRKHKPYVVVNCGALPETLFESELFGYKKGAFTDAKRDKPGKITLAEGGTLFLDEVEALPFKTQVKLLRLLQEWEYEPIGGTRTLKANIRVVAATNKQLQNLIVEGKFRDDLFFRLAVVKFDLPPLKERREDIPYLVEHFIAKFNAKRSKNIIGVSPEVMNILLKHNYLGNVRELENIIEYAFVVCRGKIIEVQHLPQEFSAKASFQEIAATHIKQVTEEIEIQEIQQALRKYYGHQGKAAKELGIDRSTLWRKAKKFNIDVRSFKKVF